MPDKADEITRRAARNLRAPHASVPANARASAPPASRSVVLASAGPTEREVLLLLSNRRATREMLQQIGSDPRWARCTKIKRALVLHPATPPKLGRRLAGELYRRELEEVAHSVQIHPSVRRLAEQLLEVRLQGMTLGERVSLARRASRGVIKDLLRCGESPVLQSLLDNARLVEMDAVVLASSRSAPPDVLSGVAAHPRWGVLRPVRLALVANPRTPIPVALRVLHSLHRQDVQRVASDVRVPRIVRMSAERLLGPRAAGPGPSRIREA